MDTPKVRHRYAIGVRLLLPWLLSLSKMAASSHNALLVGELGSHLGSRIGSVRGSWRMEGFVLNLLNIEVYV